MSHDPSRGFKQVMSDAETLMWNIEKDPWLNPSGAMLTILDRSLDIDRFTNRIAQAVAMIPRLAERVVPTLGPLPPRWVPDPEFDLSNHVRHISLPSPRTPRQLFDLCTTFHADPYDRSRPLWQFVVIDGVDGDKGALFSKLHHAVTDGIGALKLSESYIDVEREAPDVEPVKAGRVESPSGRVSDSLGHLLRRQGETIRRALGEMATWTADPGLARESLKEFADGVRMATTQLRGPGLRGAAKSDSAGSPLWSTRSRRRHLEALQLRLEDVKKAGSAMGASINDMFVGGVVLGALKYHKRRSVEVAGLNVGFVVSTRKETTLGGNAFSPVRVVVPGSCSSPQGLVADIQERMATLRKQISGNGPMVDLAGVANLLPSSVVTEFARSQAATMDFATSNLRGPPFQTYIAGAAVERNIVMGPVAGTAMNVTTMSQNGVLDIGFHIDPAAIDDPADLADCTTEAFQELLVQ